MPSSPKNNKSPALGAGGAWSIGDSNALSVSPWCGPSMTDYGLPGGVRSGASNENPEEL